jgi:hypothetical protein
MVKESVAVCQNASPVMTVNIDGEKANHDVCVCRFERFTFGSNPVRVPNLRTNDSEKRSRQARIVSKSNMNRSKTRDEEMP